MFSTRLPNTKGIEIVNGIQIRLKKKYFFLDKGGRYCRIFDNTKTFVIFLKQTNRTKQQQQKPNFVHA